MAGKGKGVIKGTKGDDTITGTDRSENISAKSGNDTVQAGGGKDKVSGGRGDDNIDGGAGNDRLHGNTGDDTLSGGAGNDRLHGGPGDDTLSGGAGNDRLDGNPGDDLLDGGAGNDRVDGKSGNDAATYVMGENAGATDSYDGGSGIDTLRLEFTRDEWMQDDVQADIAAYLQFLAQHIDPESGQADGERFHFSSFDLTARKFENLVVVVDGVELDPRDEAVDAVDDTATIEENQTLLNGSVLGNDAVPDLIRAVTLVSGPSSGTLTFGSTPVGQLYNPATDGLFSFDPGTDFDYLAVGEQTTVTFVYQVEDADHDTDTATMTIVITGTNDGPVAVADTGATEENTGLTVDVLANDTDVDLSDTHTVDSAAVVSGGGVATVVGNMVHFEPGSDFDSLAVGETATVVIEYAMSDNHGAISSSTVTIVVTGSNDAPVIALGGDEAGAVQEDSAPTATGQLSATDVDNGAVLSWSVAGGGAGAYGSLTVDGTGLWTYTLANGNANVQALAAGESHVESFTVVVTDEHGATDTQLVEVTVTGTNDAPVIASPGGDITLTDADLTGGSNDSIGGAQVVARSDFGIAPSGDVGDASLPRVSINGTISSGGDVDYYAFSLNAGETITFDIDYGMYDIDSTLVLFDGSGNVITYNDDTWEGVGGGGSFHPYDAYIAYMASVSGTYYAAVASYPNFPGVYGSSGYYAGDYVLNVSVTMPLEGGDAEGAVEEDTTLAATGQLSATDVDNGAVLTWSVAGGGAGAYGSLSVDGTGLWTYTLDNAAANVQALAAGESHVESFTVVVTDEHGATDTQLVEVTVTGTNDAPVIAAGGDVAGTVFEDGPPSSSSSSVVLEATGQLTASDVDGGSSLSWSVAGGGLGAYGALTVDASGQWTYVLDNDAANVQALAAGESHVESFTVVVTDEHGATDTQVVEITVNGTNDAPVITAGGSDFGAVQEDATVAATGQLAATDVDNGSSLSWSVAGGGTGAFGALAVDASGQWTYTLDNAAANVQALAAGESHVESFTVVVADEHGATDTQTVDVTVTGTNDAPVAGNDTIGEGDTVVLGFDGATWANVPTGYGGFDWLSSGSHYNGSADIQFYNSNIFNAWAGQNSTFDWLGDGDIDIQGLSIWNWSEVYQVRFDGYDDGVLTDSLVVGVGGSPAWVALDFDSIDRLDVVVTGGTGNGNGITGTGWWFLDSLTYNESASEAGEDTALTIAAADLLANDTDVDNGAVLSVVGVSATSALGAAVSLDVGGDIGYDPTAAAALQALAEGETATDTFTYTVTDEHGATDTATVSVAVTGVNDAPIMVGGDAAGVVQEDATLVATGQLTATDVDNGATLSWSVAGGGAGTYGALAVDASGQWTYTLDNAAADVQALAAGESHVESFTVVVTDEHGASDTQVVEVTVTGTNDAPVASAVNIYTNVTTTFGATPQTLTDADQTGGSNNSIAGAQMIARSDFGIAPSADVGDASLPRVSINGYISPNTDVDYYAFNLLAGETITLDIDYGMNQGVTIDTTLVLFDASGNVITYSDDASTGLGGGGSIHPYDAYISFTASLGGTYYASVAAYPNFPGVSNNTGGYSGDYVLNVSAAGGGLVVSEQDLLRFVGDVDNGDSRNVTAVSAATGVSATLVGGGDVLIGLAGTGIGTTPQTLTDADQTGGSNDSIAGAQVVDRSDFGIGPSADVGDASLPRVSINGYISPNTDVDYYAFNLNAGETITLDIDYGMNQGVTIDTTLVLFDASGNVITYSDDASTGLGGGGSIHPYDAYISFTASLGGTYYASVAAYPNFPGVSNNTGGYSGDYVLNVSLDARAGGGSFDYTATDSQGASDTDTVTVHQVSSSTITGAGTDDILIGGSTNDILTGGAGDDIFVFRSGGGQDTVTDFGNGADVLDFADVMGFDDFADVQGAMSQSGADTVVDLGGGDQLTLLGVDMTTLQNDDFMF